MLVLLGPVGSSPTSQGGNEGRRSEHSLADGEKAISGTRFMNFFAWSQLLKRYPFSWRAIMHVKEMGVLFM